MNETYLPGSARERILDLMKHQKVTQKDLAQRIDITESALLILRFLCQREPVPFENLCQRNRGFFEIFPRRR